MAHGTVPSRSGKSPCGAPISRSTQHPRTLHPPLSNAAIVGSGSPASPSSTLFLGSDPLYRSAPNLYALLQKRAYRLCAQLVQRTGPDRDGLPEEAILQDLLQPGGPPPPRPSPPSGADAAAEPTPSQVRARTLRSLEARGWLLAQLSAIRSRCPAPAMPARVMLLAAIVRSAGAFLAQPRLPAALAALAATPPLERALQQGILARVLPEAVVELASARAPLLRAAFALISAAIDTAMQCAALVAATRRTAFGLPLDLGIGVGFRVRGGPRVGPRPG